MDSKKSIFQNTLYLYTNCIYLQLLFIIQLIVSMRYALQINRKVHQPKIIKVALSSVKNTVSKTIAQFCHYCASLGKFYSNFDCYYTAVQILHIPLTYIRAYCTAIRHRLSMHIDEHTLHKKTSNAKISNPLFLLTCALQISEMSLRPCL